jgi:DNA segregation ATPase FtsK/SpoIIIE-like protein
MKDELLEEAKEFARKQGFVSVSYLQRIMRIGYTRASRLVDYMIEDGFCQNEYMAGTVHRQIIEAVEHSINPT